MRTTLRISRPIARSSRARGSCRPSPRFAPPFRLRGSPPDCGKRSKVGRGTLGLALDAFHLFNQIRETGEVVRTGEAYRDPTFVQLARTFELQTRFRF
jgi:hypothetical protein